MFERLATLSPLDVALMVTVFLLVLSVWIGGLLIWRVRTTLRQQRMDVRLGLALQEAGPDRTLRLWHEGHEATVNVPAAARRRSLLERFDLLCKAAGWHTSGTGVLLPVGGVMLVLFLLAYAWTSYPLAGLLAATAVPLVVWVHLNRCIDQQTALFETQLLDALGLAARSLRAGHALSGAFELIAEEIPAPVGALFGQITQQQALGLDMQEALQGAAQEVASSEFKFFTTSVSIQMRTGGNLADLMDRLAEVIRDRMRLIRRVRVLTAQTQFSKRVLMVLPLVAMVILSLINPAYMASLYRTHLGQIMLVFGGSMLLLGGWIMNHMVTLRY